MPGIDDPIDAVRRQYDEPPTNTIFEVALAAAVSVNPVASFAYAIRGMFSSTALKARLEVLFNALESVVISHGKTIDQLSSRIESPEFLEALMVAVERTTRTTDARKIQRFAHVLGFGLSSDTTSEQQSADTASKQRWENISAYIRDLSELSEQDLEALQVLASYDKSVRPAMNLETHALNPSPFISELERAVLLSPGLCTFRRADLWVA